MFPYTLSVTSTFDNATLPVFVTTILNCGAHVAPFKYGPVTLSASTQTFVGSSHALQSIDTYFSTSISGSEP